MFPGLPPNRSSIERLVGSEYIDEVGRGKVNSFLEVEGLSNIYAVGDCCDTKGGTLYQGIFKDGFIGIFTNFSIQLNFSKLTLLLIL